MGFDTCCIINQLKGMFMKAIWNDQIIAQSNDTKLVEGNHYFPPASIERKFFKNSDYETVCSWKGTASYYHLEDEDESSKNAAWYYAEPLEKASQIRGYIAFGKDVQVIEDE